MRLKLIACEVFTREICFCTAHTPHIVDIDFTAKGAHEDSDYLRKVIQNKIKDTENSEIDYDAVLLGFGLCGNSILGLSSNKLPLVVPRAHDCCTIFLGSKEKFTKYFKDRLSAEWTSPGYLERGDSMIRSEDIEDTLKRNKSYQELVDQYGQENAEYVWETLHPEKNADSYIYIEMDEFAHLNYLSQIKEKADKENKDFEIIQGSMSLISRLIDGKWDQEDFLILEPGDEIKAIYDFEKIITAGDG